MITNVIPKVSLLIVVLILCLCSSSVVRSQTEKPAMPPKEKAIADQIGKLRSLPDDVRAKTTKQLALEIRELPSSMNKLNLASGLANFSTEGDFGRDTLQEVTTTLAGALREQPQRMSGTDPAYAYVQLAMLVRYEKMSGTSDDPQFAMAMKKLEENDAAIEHADFTLTDLDGKNWTLQSLHGKVVLVNFWATWCPPCRKEMPDLDALYRKFKDKGLVVLAISDEEMAKVKPFLAERSLAFPILLDPGRKINELFRIEGIPKTFIYDREGKLAAQSIDMRTEKQFLEMLSRAGLDTK
jgi:peroxiredoxin